MPTFSCPHHDIDPINYKIEPFFTELVKTGWIHTRNANPSHPHPKNQCARYQTTHHKEMPNSRNQRPKQDSHNSLQAAQQFWELAKEASLPEETIARGTRTSSWASERNFLRVLDNPLLCRYRAMESRRRVLVSIGDAAAAAAAVRWVSFFARETWRGVRASSLGFMAIEAAAAAARVLVSGIWWEMTAWRAPEPRVLNYESRFSISSLQLSQIVAAPGTCHKLQSMLARVFIQWHKWTLNFDLTYSLIP